MVTKQITNRFKTTCIECKKQVNKSEQVIYIPDLKKIKCLDCADYSIIGHVDAIQEDYYFSAMSQKLGF
tara:strand:- start:49 stop:255 length:207 start_codon:yes stop_codon:yes gene_type:complete